MEGSSCEQWRRSTHSQQGTTWECRICLDNAQDPVCTLCGHVFCWPCLYLWLRDHPKPCPVCKVLRLGINSNFVPIYTGTELVTPVASAMESNGVRIPRRPRGTLLQQPSIAFSVQTSRSDLQEARVEATTTRRSRDNQSQPVTRPDHFSSEVGRLGVVSGAARSTSLGLSQQRSPVYQIVDQAVRGVYERREMMYQDTINGMVSELTELRRETESLQRRLAAVQRFISSRRGEDLMRRISSLSLDN